MYSKKAPPIGPGCGLDQALDLPVIGCMRQAASQKSSRLKPVVTKEGNSFSNDRRDRVAMSVSSKPANVRKAGSARASVQDKRLSDEVPVSTPLPPGPDHAGLAVWKVEQLVAIACRKLGASDDEHDYVRNWITRILAAMAPRDCLEEMVAHNVICAHFAARDSFEQAALEVASDRKRNLHIKYASILTVQLERLITLFERLRDRSMVREQEAALPQTAFPAPPAAEDSGEEVLDDRAEWDCFDYQRFALLERERSRQARGEYVDRLVDAVVREIGTGRLLWEYTEDVDVPVGWEVVELTTPVTWNDFLSIMGITYFGLTEADLDQ